MLDSIVKVKKKYYTQTLLEECKYEIKKTKMENFINDELEARSCDDEGDSDSDNESDNKPEKPSRKSGQRCLLLQTLASSLHLHLQVSYNFVCLVSLVLHIRLNTLTFMFLTTSGTHIFEYGSLILLQIPLYLFSLIL